MHQSVLLHRGHPLQDQQPVAPLFVPWLHQLSLLSHKDGTQVFWNRVKRADKGPHKRRKIKITTMKLRGLRKSSWWTQGRCNPLRKEDFRFAIKEKVISESKVSVFSIYCILYYSSAYQMVLSSDIACLRREGATKRKSNLLSGDWKASRISPIILTQKKKSISDGSRRLNGGIGLKAWIWFICR